jgi:uncharacterized protein YdaU (DUF1376 family)
MSKDPAVLFYTSDFISGTLTMSYEQKGKYIILLCLQHEQGYLTEDDMLNICKTYDEKIFKKFIKDENGNYFNQRMRLESERRKKYSESRSKNRKNISESYDKHMENENENINVIKNRKRRPFKIPTIQEVRNFFDENGYDPDFGETRWHYYNDANWIDSHGSPVLSWKQKMRAVWFKPEHKKVEQGIRMTY